MVALYNRSDLQSIIEEYAIFYLMFLVLPKPPEVLFGVEKGRPDCRDYWEEGSLKACLYLYLTLLPIKQELIHELVYRILNTIFVINVFFSYPDSV